MYGAGNGAGGALNTNQNNNDLQLNSTSVTPYLKPTARNPEPSMQHVLSSPFMKGIGVPQAHYPTIGFGSMLGGPAPHLGQPAISPMHHAGGYNYNMNTNAAANNGQQQNNTNPNGANANNGTGSGGNGANGGNGGAGTPYGTLMSTG